MVAREGFGSSVSLSLRGKRLGITHEGIVVPGARFWSDDPIVMHNPEMFLDASELPPPDGPSALPDASADPSSALWAASGWLEIVKAYRACRDPRPSQVDVAEQIGLSEQAVRDRLRKLGIRDWRLVHALIAARA